jgi:hypothetical protein
MSRDIQQDHGYDTVLVLINRGNWESHAETRRHRASLTGFHTGSVSGLVSILTEAKGFNTWWSIL